MTYLSGGVCVQSKVCCSPVAVRDEPNVGTTIVDIEALYELSGETQRQLVMVFCTTGHVEQEHDIQLSPARCIQYNFML